MNPILTEMANSPDRQPTAPIGVFDSGVGGLSVLRAIHAELPGEELLYLADQAHVPYGPRQLEEVQAFAHEITRYLLSKQVKQVVVACNAASAAALVHLRRNFPSVDFVGMEPAVKPAATHSASRIVAVLATPATFQGALYASVVERFASGVVLLQDTCPGLVERIEAGDLSSPATRKILEDALLPMLALGADTVVLGCTHYPFVIPLIQEISGPSIQVIDPAPAVARQVRRVLESKRLVRPGKQKKKPRAAFQTTGDPHKLAEVLQQILGWKAEIAFLTWKDGRIYPQSSD